MFNGSVVLIVFGNAEISSGLSFSPELSPYFSCSGMTQAVVKLRGVFLSEEMSPACHNIQVKKRILNITLIYKG